MSSLERKFTGKCNQISWNSCVHLTFPFVERGTFYKMHINMVRFNFKTYQPLHYLLIVYTHVSGCCNYWTIYSPIVRMLVLPNFFNIKRSWSPVIKCVAFPSCASANRKLSFGSLQRSTFEITVMNFAFFWTFVNNSSMSSSEKYLLNFGRRATSINSSIAIPD